MSKYCRYCGAQAEDNARFCSICGNSFEPPEEQIFNDQPAKQGETEPLQRGYNQSEPSQPDYQYKYGDRYDNRYQYNYPQQPVQYVNPPTVKQKKPGKGFGIASMVLGIAAAVNSLILMLINMGTGAISTMGNTEGRVAATGLSVAIIAYASFICLLALLSLVFGIVSLVKGNKGTAIAGLILTGISIAVCVFSFVLVANLDKASLSEMIDYGKKNNSSYSFKFDDDIQDYENYFRDFLE